MTTPQKYYTQGDEEKYITEYFAGKKGKLLSIGENDGSTFSNALHLIELGWSALLIEPAPTAYEKCAALHRGNSGVNVLNAAITETDGEFVFWDSGTHLGKGDTSLLSTIVEKELDRWKNTDNKFKPINVIGVTIATLKKEIDNFNFDFISIDAEGLDLAILKQIDLTHTQMVCIEWNLNISVKNEISRYCASYGLNKMIYSNSENLIIVR